MHRNPGTPPDRKWKRLAWFAGLWAASLIVFALVVYGIKLVMPY